MWSLINGLHKSDRVIGLQQRLDEFPDELNELYRHILRRLAPRYEKEASKMIQIIGLSVEVQKQDPSALLQLSLAEQDPTKARSVSIKPLSEEQSTARCEATEGRIRSRCCGLMKVHEIRRRRFERRRVWELSKAHVTLLHWTVLEYLLTDTV